LYERASDTFDNPINIYEALYWNNTELLYTYIHAHIQIRVFIHTYVSGLLVQQLLSRRTRTTTTNKIKEQNSYGIWRSCSHIAHTHHRTIECTALMWSDWSDCVLFLVFPLSFHFFLLIFLKALPVVCCWPTTLTNIYQKLILFGFVCVCVCELLCCCLNYKRSDSIANSCSLLTQLADKWQMP